MNDDLVQFLHARLDEDEQAARAAGGAPWEATVPGMVHVSAAAQRDNRGMRSQGYVAAVERAEIQHHIARQDPPAVLARATAMRSIVRHWEYWEQGEIGRGPWAQACRHLAKIYASHPDFREEWRP